MIYLSVCSRSEDADRPTLKKLRSWVKESGDDNACKNPIALEVEFDASSIYEGHKANFKKFKELWVGLSPTDIIVMCHDDVEILSTHEKFQEMIAVARSPGAGFVGVAGACKFGVDGAWWNARRDGSARGFVWQGPSDVEMTPNYFGKPGQVAVLDGCFIAATWETICKIGMDQPSYLSSGWDYYDIHLTFMAYLEGLTNYTVPIMIRHESSGVMRKGWYDAKHEFMKEHKPNIPCSLPVNKTNGLPLQE
mgnify:CR=1 FL=1